MARYISKPLSVTKSVPKEEILALLNVSLFLPLQRIIQSQMNIFQTHDWQHMLCHIDKLSPGIQSVVPVRFCQVYFAMKTDEIQPTC